MSRQVVVPRGKLLAFEFALLIFLPALLPGAVEAPGLSSGSPTDPAFDSVRRLLDDGKYADAEAAARQLIAKEESETGADSLQTAKAIDLLVESFWRTVGGMRPEALVFGQRALGLKEKLLGAEDPEMAISLVNLGGVLRQTGDYAGAVSAFERSLTIRQQTPGPGSLPVAESLSGLALAMQDMGRLDDARRLLERALSMLESQLPSDHPLVATAYSNLGIVMRNSGEYASAIAAHKHALSIREKVLVPGHPDIALTLGNLGGLYYLTGDFAGAREMYERTLPLREKAYGPVNPRVAEILNNMADLARDMGNYEEARALYDRALKIWNATLGPQHPYTALSSEGLARLLRIIGDLAGAEPLFRSVVQVWETSAGPSHPLVAINLRNLADVLRERGDYAGARPLYERSLSILESAPIPNQPEVSTSLTGLADLLAATGDFTGARPLYERSLEITRKSLGERHPRVAEDLIGLARVSWATGGTTAALRKSLEAEAIFRDHLKVTARSLSEREALLYEKRRAGGLDLALSAISGPPMPPQPDGVVAGVWDEVIRSRAMVLDEMASRHRTVFDLESPQLLSRVGELDAARAAYARLAMRGRPEEQPDKYREALEQARRSMERAERALASRSARFRKQAARSMMGIAEAGAGLPEGSALVSYVAYGRYAPPQTAGVPHGLAGPEQSYMALVKVQGKPGLRAFALGSIAAVDGLIGGWRLEAGAPATNPAGLARYVRAGDALRAAIWDPVAPALAGVKLVFVVPDGALHNVSLATLPSGSGRYLIETGPLIHYLSTERDLVRPPATGPTGTGLLVLGGPDYDAKPGSSPASASNPAANTAPPAPPRISAEADSGGSGRRPAQASTPCADLQSMRFRPLPGAGYEADEVESLWLRKGRSVLKLTGSAAAEESFKKHAAGQEVLHLATHGFFLRGDCDPLQLSGLALAGANRRSAAEAALQPDDGILTAEEIASLDLRGVKWAVLSACETGLGPLQTGEGVLGLRRAFEVAGAGTLILSLWEIGDHDARDWVRGLYEARLRGLSTAEAVREAAVRMIEVRRRQGEAATHPFSWGAFVAAGDWR